MSGPPLGTLWIDLLPLTNPEFVIGIDTAFFNVNSIFKGIKEIPPGIHLFHYAEGDDMRAGWWFEIHENQVLSIYWDCEKEQFMEKHVSMDQIGNEYHLLVLYPENIDAWRALTRDVSMSYINTISPAFPSPITTATPLKEENMVLERTLKNKDHKQTFEDQSSEELAYTIILFKLTGLKEDSSVEQITKNALDRTWQIEKLFQTPDHFLAELQTSFINFCVLANLCSCTHWTSLLRLTLLSEAMFLKYPGFTSSLLETFLAQLEKIPEEYVQSPDIGVVDTSELVNALERLRSIFAQSSRWQKIEGVCRSRFGFHIKNLEAPFDVDNFEVYDIEDHDDDDEDAPAIID